MASKLWFGSIIWLKAAAFRFFIKQAYIQEKSTHLVPLCFNLSAVNSVQNPMRGIHLLKSFGCFSIKIHKISPDFPLESKRLCFIC